jgi:hypothetical protein
MLVIDDSNQKILVLVFLGVFGRWGRKHWGLNSEPRPYWQVLYNLSYATNPFWWRVFFEIGSHELFAGVGPMILLISASWVARITGVSHLNVPISSGLCVLTRRIQAEHMDVVREIRKFYYRKGGRGLQVGSLPGRMEALCTGKKREGFYFRLFLHHP